MKRFMASILVVMLGITSIETSAEEFHDPDYGLRFDLDDERWKPAALPVATLGEPLAVVTTGPELAALAVVFVRTQQDASPAGDGALDSIAERLGRLADAVNAEIITSEIEEIAGRRAVSFRMTGPGSGIGIGQGNITTTQHWIAFLRDRDLFVFQLTAAADKFEASYGDLRKMAESAKFEASRPQREQPTFDEDELGLRVDYPAAPWIRGGYELGDLVVPGYSLRLWSAPSSTGKTDNGKTAYANRLAMFLQFPGKAFTPQELLDISVQGLSTIGAEVITQEIRKIDEQDAMWLLVEGKSKSGANLTGQGDVATRQLWVAIPRVREGQHNIVVFLLNTPAADYDERFKEFEAMLKTLSVEADPA